MRLLDGHHEVMVQLRAPVSVPGHGTEYAPTGEPIPVRCTVRMLSTTETADLGVVDRTVIRILARSWPGDARSQITWRGQGFQPRGLPLIRDGSRTTSHVEVVAVSDG